ncbi:serine/threonine-protein kinase SBK1-like [Ischnura elegans]|uniref:serine/threonine-protein kinase SBK1-like n=1 Tax=Ischnura elegans TaxID=197161 RepID=UPI001ED8BF0A|nr:serine/threonine-protein kinase SBK1-like [Ischnura elegans]
MGSLDTPIHNIHRIRDFEMEKVDLLASYEILQVLDAGWFGQVLLAEPKRGAPGSRRRREESDGGGGSEIVLKAVRKGQTSREDFLREYHYNVELGKRHKGILRTLGPPFETATLLVFPLEAAPLGDLASHLSDRGVGGGERPTKAVARQLASALAYMRQRASLVHRDVRPQRVLLFASDCSRVKLSGFGEARPAGTLVRRRRGKEWPPYAPPEVVEATTNTRYPAYYDDISEAGSVYFGEEDNLSLYGDSLLTSTYDEGAPPYQAHYAQDAWMLAVTLLVCLTGCLPWTRASSDDPRYARYLRWRTGRARRVSALVLGGRGGAPTRAFGLLSARAQRMFRRLLDPKPEKRPPVEEVVRYIDERWLPRSAMADGKEEEGIEDDSDLCPSLYSFHSSPEEKNRLLKTLTEYGVETTVDRSAKKDRIRQWVQLSGAILEEDEEEEEEGGASSNEAEEGSGGEEDDTMVDMGRRGGVGGGGPRGGMTVQPPRGVGIVSRAPATPGKARKRSPGEDSSGTAESASH